MDGHFSDTLRILNNGKNKTHLLPTLNRTLPLIRHVHICVIIRQLNLIGAMKTFTKPNCNLCMEERLTILKKLHDRSVTIMNKNLEIYVACRHKTTFHRFCVITDDPVLNGWKGYSVKRFSNITTWTYQRLFWILIYFKLISYEKLN